MGTENPVILFLNKMADLLLLNVLFIISCIPLITIGPAITALYHVTLRSIRYGDGYIVQEYTKAFRRNFLQSVIAWIVTVIFAVLVWIDFCFWGQKTFGVYGTIMLCISACFAFLGFIILLWLFPVLAKIENTLWANIKNAAAMAIGHFFPYTIICAAITVAVFYMAYVSLIADVLLLLVGFSLLAYILSFFFYKVFARYLEETPVGEEDPLYGKNRDCT